MSQNEFSWTYSIFQKWLVMFLSSHFFRWNLFNWTEFQLILVHSNKTDTFETRDTTSKIILTLEQSNKKTKSLESIADHVGNCNNKITLKSAAASLCLKGAEKEVRLWVDSIKLNYSSSHTAWIWIWMTKRPGTTSDNGFIFKKINEN